MISPVSHVRGIAADLRACSRQPACPAAKANGGPPKPGRRETAEAAGVDGSLGVISASAGFDTSRSQTAEWPVLVMCAADFGRGARMARRDDREYPEYLREEQRSQPGCPGRKALYT